jgi:hypothetical protein
VANVGEHGRESGLKALQAKVTLWFRRLDTKGRVATIGAGVVVVVLLVAGVVLAVSSSRAKQSAASTTSTTTTTTSPPTSTTRPKKPHVVGKVCPLTGTAAPHGIVPKRPALGVKIGNDPASRPQSGLPDADIVYEEMAEGGVTRYLAIFQCYVPPVIGPTRSVRWDDWHLLASYGHPILAFSGGIDQWDAAVASISTNDGGGPSGWLFDANGSEGTTVAAYYRTSDRYPPYNYYTSGNGLWSMDPNHNPPPRQFNYSNKPPKRSLIRASAVIHGFASGSDVDWQWSGRDHGWLRSYGGQPDTDAGGPQLKATNVIIELVPTQPGPYAESGTIPDVESLTQGSGPAWILRNGKVEIGTWNCPAYGDITTYRFSNGKPMTLAPGNTWIEVVPNAGYPVTIQR